jgi:hypothetical protein
MYTLIELLPPSIIFLTNWPPLLLNLSSHYIIFVVPSASNTLTSFTSYQLPPLWCWGIGGGATNGFGLLHHLSTPIGLNLKGCFQPVSPDCFFVRWIFCYVVCWNKIGFVDPSEDFNNYKILKVQSVLLYMFKHAWL